MSKRQYIRHPNYRLSFPAEEFWYDIPRYEGFYQASSHGRIKSLARIVPMCDGRKYRVSEKILKPAWDGKYFHVIFSNSGKEYVELVHRVVLEAHVGECPEGLEACHNDGNSKNNRLENLRWDTHKSNMEEIGNFKKPDWATGERHGMSKLTENNVREIKKRLKDGENHRHIAKDFNVTETAIRGIRSGRNWSHVTIEGI